MIKEIKNYIDEKLRNNTCKYDDVEAKVWFAKTSGVKLVTVPKHCYIKTGDIVAIRKV